MSSVLLGLEKPSFAWRAMETWSRRSATAEERLGQVLQWVDGGPWALALIQALTGVRETAPSALRTALVRHFERDGEASVRRQLTAFALRGWSTAGTEAYRIEEETFVRLALASGCVAEMLAERTEVAEEVAFFGGVFAWLGLIPVARLLGKVRPELRYDASLADLSHRLRWEREQTHTDSLGISAKLLGLWGFGEIYLAGVRGTAYPLLVLQGRPLAMLSYLAQHLGAHLLQDEPRCSLDRTAKKCLETLVLPTAPLEGILFDAEAMAEAAMGGPLAPVFA